MVPGVECAEFGHEAVDIVSSRVELLEHRIEDAAASAPDPATHCALPGLLAMSTFE
jgi:hypothetical protein